MLFSRIAIALCLSLTLIPQGWADEAQFGSIVDVHLATVDLWAIDSDGNMVPDLDIDDLTLKVDGEEMLISTFSEPREVLEAMAAEADDESLMTMPAPAPLYIALVVDGPRLSPGTRNALFDQAEEVLDKVRLDGAKIMLVQLGDFTASVRHGFGDEDWKLDEAFEAMRKEATGAPHHRSEDNSLLTTMSRPDSGGGGGLSRSTVEDDANIMLSQLRSVAELRYAQASASLSALQSLIDALAGLDGRKLVLHLSEGLPVRPAEHLLGVWQSRYATTQLGRGTSVFAELNRFDLSSEIARLEKSANAARVVLHVLGGEDKRGSAVNAASSGAVRELTSTASEATVGGDGLIRLAAATGGRATPGTQAAAFAIESAVNSVEQAYVVGFTIPAQQAEDYARVELSCNRPGVRLRYRQGVRVVAGTERLAQGVSATHLFGSGTNILGVRLEVGEPRKAEQRGAVLVPIMVKIPLGGLTLVPDGAAHGGRLMLAIAAAPPGTPPQPATQPFPVRVPNDQLLTALGQSAGYTFQLLMTPGQQRVAVAVRDELGAVDSFLVEEVEIGEAVREQ